MDKVNNGQFSYEEAIDLVYQTISNLFSKALESAKSESEKDQIKARQNEFIQTYKGLIENLNPKIDLDQFSKLKVIF